MALLPDLVLKSRRTGIAVRRLSQEPAARTSFAVTRATDVARPSTRALLAAVRDASENLGRATQ